MIGVVCSSSQRTAAAEFFELFKTPWEFYTPGRMYSVVISTQGWPTDVRAQLVVLYGSNPSKEAILAVLPAPSQRPRWKHRP